MKITLLLITIYCVAFAGETKTVESSPIISSEKSEYVQFELKSLDGAIELKLVMPPKDAIFMALVAKNILGKEFNSEFDEFFQGQSSMLVNEYIESSEFNSNIISDIDPVKFILDRKFTDAKGDYQLYMKMPSNYALRLLAAAYSLGDNRFKYQIMQFGFSRYSGKDTKEEILALLSESFPNADKMLKIDILISMFSINRDSPHTLEVMDLATKIPGSDNINKLTREIAIDLKNYLLTGNEDILKKYNVELQDF